MANRLYNKNVVSPHAAPVVMAFYVPIDGSSAVGTASAGSATFVTVTKPTGTGIYRATFTDAFLDVLYADCQIFKAAGTLDLDVRLVAVTNAGTATALVVDFQTVKTSDGTAVDPTSVSLYFLVVARNSQVTP